MSIASAPQDADWPAEFRFLSTAASYPSDAVQVVETSMSWVFLTDHEVFKAKKRLLYEGIDFADPATRRRNAVEEVRLNRRLAPDVYLGVMTLTHEPYGGFALGGTGRPVDWLVWMRRLPAASMLDDAIRGGRLRRPDIQRVACLLAAFLVAAPRIGMSSAGYLARLRREIERSVTEISALGPVELGRSAGLDGARLERFLVDHALLLSERAPLLVDAHGDLRPEHVCLSQPPAIIDCLEFSAELRLRDPVDELAYLGMECARLGAPGIGPVLLAAYREASNDREGLALLPFYRAFRAIIRARLAIAHLRSHSRHPPETWVAQARSYLAISSFEIALAGFNMAGRPSSGCDA